jgi:hypothetical protein
MMADRLAGKRVDPCRGTAGIGFLALGLRVAIVSALAERLVTCRLEFAIAAPTTLRGPAAAMSMAVVEEPKQVLT